MADKPPAYQWYPKDAETDEAYRLMTCEQLGAYERLRDHQWIEGSLPTDVEELALIVGHGMTAKRLEQIWARVSVCFPPTADGRLQNPRLERQREELEAYRKRQADNGRKGAAKKHGVASE